jgi:hypothetical protein
MAKLGRETVQRLAVLRALTLWRRGPYGPVRLQKTMFRADQNHPEQKRLFTFKKYYLGQYSQQIAEALWVRIPILTSPRQDWNPDPQLV